jgi:hypothetical protein
MSGDRPKVSIVIPCFRAVGYVAEALDSVFAQTFTDFEVLVVNDGSPQTVELEALLRPHRSRIRYLREENRGPAAARNAAIVPARGELVAFLDSDDVWHPEFLAEVVGILERDPSLAMAYAGSTMFGDSVWSRRVGVRSQPERVDATFENLVLRRCHVHPSCVVARRAPLIAVGLFDEALIYSEDLDLWARLTHAGGRIGHHPRTLTRRRFHDQSLTAAIDRLILGQLGMTRKLLVTLPELTASQRAALERNAALCGARLQLVYATGHLLRGQDHEAERALAAANRVLGSRKLRAALAALRLSPRLTRWFLRRVLAGHPAVASFRGEHFEPGPGIRTPAIEPLPAAVAPARRSHVL